MHMMEDHLGVISPSHGGHKGISSPTLRSSLYSNSPWMVQCPAVQEAHFRAVYSQVLETSIARQWVGYSPLSPVLLSGGK